MKRRFLILPALCLTLTFGCDSGDRRTAQSDGYQETEGLNEAETPDQAFGTETERTSAAGLEEDTREFVTEAASSSMMEVELARLAQEKAQAQQVKDFAQMIANDHQQANQELQNLAQQKNINVPQTMKEDHREKMEDLREKTGSEFDKEYMDLMVEQHEKSIDKFESKQEEVQDPEVKNWVENTLTTLRQHKEQAEQINEQIGNSGSNSIIN